MAVMSAKCYLFLGSDRAKKRARIAAIAASAQVGLLDTHHVLAADLSVKLLHALLRQQAAAGPVRLLVIDEAQRCDAACAQVLAEAAQHDPAIGPGPSAGGPSVVLQRSGGRDVAPRGTSDRVPRALPVGLHESQAIVILLVDGALSAKQPLSSVKPHAAVESFGEESARGAGTSSFALVQAVARHDAAAALQAMQEQLAAGKDVFELFGLLIWQLQRWLLVSRVQASGRLRREGESLTGLPAWQLQRTVEELTGRPTSGLVRMAQRSLALDQAAKSGRIMPQMALEQLVVELCRR